MEALSRKARPLLADARGLIVRPIVHLNVMLLPLTMTRQDVDFVVDTLRESIEATTHELRDQGHWKC